MSKQIWLFTCLICAIGAVGQISLALEDSRENPAPAFSMPLFWLWIASPSIACILTSAAFRNRSRLSVVLFAWSLVSSIGGYWLLLRDANWESTDGRNPFLATSGILISLTIYPVLHWALLLTILCVTAMSFKKLGTFGR